MDLVFLGDSITQDWEKHGPPEWQDFAPQWQRFYGDRNAVNLGFKGDTTASLIWRLQHGEVDGIHPKAAVVLIGANNNGRVHWSADQTLGGIAAVIAELHQQPARDEDPAAAGAAVRPVGLGRPDHGRDQPRPGRALRPRRTLRSPTSTSPGCSCATASWTAPPSSTAT